VKSFIAICRAQETHVETRFIRARSESNNFFRLGINSTQIERKTNSKKIIFKIKIIFHLKSFFIQVLNIEKVHLLLLAIGCISMA
jgi:hypothetical protein